MQRLRGFTLVEILLVLLVIAMMASAIGLAARPGQSRELAIAASQWQRSVQRLSAEAMAQSEVLALSFNGSEPVIKMRDGERWENYAQRIVLPDSPEHISLSLREGSITVLPNGEINAFQLELVSSLVDGRYQLRSDGLQLTVEMQ